MKSISARFNRARSNKLAKEQQSDQKGSLLDHLQSLIQTDSSKTGVTSVELYIRNPALNLTYSPESDVWESKFPKHFETRIVLRIMAGFSDDLMLLEGLKEVYVFHYDCQSSSVSWRISPIDCEETLKKEGFEKAQTVSGPFPLRYILDFLSVSQFKLYSSPPPAKQSNESIFAERDFAIQLMQYLEHLETTRHSVDRSNSPTRDAFRFQSRMQSNISLLSCESDQIVHGNPNPAVSPRIHRVFYPHNTGFVLQYQTHFRDSR